MTPGQSGARDEDRGGGPRTASCAECGGTGYRIHTAEDGVARARRCPCGWVDRVATLLKDARIPRRYRSCSFDSYDTLNASLARAKIQVQKFVDEYPMHDFGLLLLGPCGVGKTHLAASALNFLVREKGVSGIFYDFRDLLKEIQASYNPVSGTTEMGILQPIFGADVLVLDDLGATKMTDWVRDTLSHIINNRYNERRVTIVTTNLEDEVTSAARGDERVRERPSLRDQIGDPLRSRLYEMCEVIDLAGDDYRIKVKHTARRPGPLG
jgi:DNA replication protein DnaC